MDKEDGGGEDQMVHTTPQTAQHCTTAKHLGVFFLPRAGLNIFSIFVATTRLKAITSESRQVSMGMGRTDRTQVGMDDTKFSSVQ